MGTQILQNKYVWKIATFVLPCKGRSVTQSYAKILGGTNFQTRETPRSGSKDGEKKKKKKMRERLNDGENNGQATHGARKHAWRTQAAWAKRRLIATKVQAGIPHTIQDLIVRTSNLGRIEHPAIDLCCV